MHILTQKLFTYMNVCMSCICMYVCMLYVVYLFDVISIYLHCVCQQLTMSDQSLAQLRFDTMKHGALTDTVPKDLPQLLCHICKQCQSFGESERR